MLKTFLFERSQRRLKITEGIDHIEALSPRQFVHALTHIDKYVASEKLDGYNLWFGFDDQGFFTSRGNKGGATFRSVDDYENTPASNGFRAVHDALSQVQDVLKRFVHDGETVEVEVLFGKQPNAIVYGENMIAFLRFIDSAETSDSTTRLKQLQDALKSTVVSTTTVHTETQDGLSLQDNEATHEWKFVTPGWLDKSVLKTINLDKEIAAIRKFLHAPNKALPDMSNGDILTANLTSVPSGRREEVKKERENVNDVFTHEHKLPIKNKLVQLLLRDTKPKLQTASVGKDENIGIEGIVFLDPETNEQFKLVDKDLFTSVNKFNFAVRSVIRNTGGPNPYSRSLNIKDGDSSIMDDMVSKIGRTFGMSQDLKYYTVGRTLKKYGSNPQEIVDALAANVTDSKSAKGEIEQAIISAVRDLKSALERFKGEWKSYHTTLPSGKTVRYNEELYRRTLTSFAEANEELKAMYHKVSNAKNAAHLASVVFSRQLKGETDSQ